MRIIIILIIAYILLSCQTSSVRNEDLNSWINHSESELLSHPFFKDLSKIEKELSGESKLLILTEHKIRYQSPHNCFIGAGLGYDSMVGLKTHFCNEHEAFPENCDYRFIIKSGKILSYNLMGINCRTSCLKQPNPIHCSEE